MSGGFDRDHSVDRSISDTITTSVTITASTTKTWTHPYYYHALSYESSSSPTENIVDITSELRYNSNLTDQPMNILQIVASILGIIIAITFIIIVIFTLLRKRKRLHTSSLLIDSHSNHLNHHRNFHDNLHTHLHNNDTYTRLFSSTNTISPIIDPPPTKNAVLLEPHSLNDTFIASSLSPPHSPYAKLAHIRHSHLSRTSWQSNHSELTTDSMSPRSTFISTLAISYTLVAERHRLQHQQPYIIEHYTQRTHPKRILD
ncbi:hypothetical protein BDB01DRAFT_782397 [Pilobolus umbonatus]|nr:hypothetical protein BDB01DRAFT_782397 [Pilobolus umbonatus]